MNIQEQLDAIRSAKRAQFDAYRAQLQTNAETSASSAAPVPSDAPTVPSDVRTDPGNAPTVPSDVRTDPGNAPVQASISEFDPVKAMKRLGPDATIGDLLADAPKKPKVRRVEPPPPPEPPELEGENAQVILEVKQAPTGTLRLISWNIDGIDEKCGDVIGRTIHVCSELIDEAVSVAFLQEVIAPTLQIIQRLMGRLYHIVVPPRPAMPYFCVMLLQKDRVKIKSPVAIIQFESRMGRELMGINVEIDDCPVWLSTAHLESTKTCAPERRKQFEIAIQRLRNAPEGLAIFGGDLNLRDDEAKRLMKMTDSVGSYADAWESANKPPDARFTWDLQRNDNCAMQGNFKPRCRFDRVYFREQYECKKFALVGTQRLPEIGRFPSDHFGVLIEWNLKKNAASPTRPKKMREAMKKAKTADQCIVLDSDYE